MKNKYLFLITSLFLFIAVLSGCNDMLPRTSTPPATDPSPASQPAPANEQTNTANVPDTQKVSAENDNGCVKEEGYTWCEAKKLCIKEAEEKCEMTEGEPKPKMSYNLIEEALAKKYDKSPDDFTLGIQNLSLSHFRGIVSHMEGIVLAAKHNNDWIIAFDSVFGENKTYTCNEIAPYYFPPDMISDCVK